MVDFLSQRNGPHKEDLAARRVIQENRGTIKKLMNHLTGGQLHTMRKPPTEPQSDGLIISIGGGKSTIPVRPYVRISINGRVVVADEESNRQLHFLGEIRGVRRNQRFVLATKENGFSAQIDEDMLPALADLDGREITSDFSEDQLATDIRQRLGIDADRTSEPADDR